MNLKLILASLEHLCNVQESLMNGAPGAAVFTLFPPSVLTLVGLSFAIQFL
jgi:hypothetical protein